MVLPALRLPRPRHAAPRRGSGADIAIPDAGPLRHEAEAAALAAACEAALGLTADIVCWEDLGPAIRAEALRDGLRCSSD